MEKKNWIHLLRIIGITLVVYLTFRYLLPLVVPFVLAVVTAKVMAPLVDKCYLRVPICKKVMAPVFLFLFLVIMISFFGFIAMACANQVMELARNFTRYQNVWEGTTTQWCCVVDDTMGLEPGASIGFVSTHIVKTCQGVMNQVIPMARETFFTLGRIGFSFFMYFISTIMILACREELSKSYRKCFLYPMIHPVIKRLKQTGIVFLRAQGIIIFIVSVICVTALTLIGNPYALLFGICIGIVDAFPVVGSGSILIPYALIRALSADYVAAAILASAYVVTLLIREVLEPRLLGNRLGVLPVTMLFAVFVGIRLFGATGVLLGPAGLMIIRESICSFRSHDCQRGGDGSQGTHKRAPYQGQT